MCIYVYMHVYGIRNPTSLCQLSRTEPGATTRWYIRGNESETYRRGDIYIYMCVCIKKYKSRLPVPVVEHGAGRNHQVRPRLASLLQGREQSDDLKRKGRNTKRNTIKLKYRRGAQPPSTLRVERWSETKRKNDMKSFLLWNTSAQVPKGGQCPSTLRVEGWYKIKRMDHTRKFYWISTEGGAASFNAASRAMIWNKKEGTRKEILLH